MIDQHLSSPTLLSSDTCLRLVLIHGHFYRSEYLQIVGHLSTPSPTFFSYARRSDETLSVGKHVVEKQTASLPSTSPSSSLSGIETKEDVLYWEGYLDEEYIEKKYPKPIRNLRYMFFSVYRRLFGITFGVNMAVFIWLTAAHQANTGKIAYAVLSNFVVSILIRQEYVINTLFAIFTAWPQSAPLLIRRVSAHIFHIGGRKCRPIIVSRHSLIQLTCDVSVHSGCSISGTVWFIIFVAVGTREYIHGLSPVRTHHWLFANGHRSLTVLYADHACHSGCLMGNPGITLGDTRVCLSHHAPQVSRLL